MLSSPLKTEFKDLYSLGWIANRANRACSYDLFESFNQWSNRALSILNNIYLALQKSLVLTTSCRHLGVRQMRLIVDPSHIVLISFLVRLEPAVAIILFHRVCHSPIEHHG